MKILIAADGSEFTGRMLAYLAGHDQMFGLAPQFTVLTVVPPLPARAAAALHRDVVTAHYGEAAEEVLAPVRTFFEKHAIAADYVHKVGHAADVIASVAEHDHYDLLVMGSHGHGVLGTMMLGSVTMKVMAGCKTPVLIVR